MTAAIEVSTGKITRNPRQPRQHLDEGSLNELAASIQEHGVIQPLVVTPNGSGYILIAGERRLEASKLAGLETVPAIVREADDQALAELALIENLQRADLSPVEEAQAYDALATDFGLTDEEIGQRVGKSRPVISNARRLLDLPEDARDLVHSSKLPLRHARAMIPLARLDADLCDQLAQALVAGKFNHAPFYAHSEEHAIRQAIKSVTAEMDGEWNTDWLGKKTPTVETEAGPVQVRACRGCERLVTLGKSHSKEQRCANAACLQAKWTLWQQHVVARQAEKLGIPVVDGEAVTLIKLDNWATRERVEQWLEQETPPAHLRLVAEYATGYSRHDHRRALGSAAISIATTNPASLKRGDKAKQIVPENESPGDKTKRLKAEERERAKRRREKGRLRRAKADVLWLAQNAAEHATKHVKVDDPVLDWLQKHLAHVDRPVTSWAKSLLEANSDAQDEAAGKELKRLQRERIALLLIQKALGDVYDEKRIWDTTRAIHDIEFWFGFHWQVDLPHSWRDIPVHKTPTNCHVCGQFSSMDKGVTKVEKAAGWQIADGGVVTCSDKCRKADEHSE